MNILGNFINDFFIGCCGYLASHLICCDYTYKHRQYVIERMIFEKDNNINRDTYDLGTKLVNGQEENVLLDEYPFA